MAWSECLIPDIWATYRFLSLNCKSTVLFSALWCWVYLGLYRPHFCFTNYSLLGSASGETREKLEGWRGEKELAPSLGAYSYFLFCEQWVSHVCSSWPRAVWTQFPWGATSLHLLRDTNASPLVLQLQGSWSLLQLLPLFCTSRGGSYFPQWLLLWFLSASILPFSHQVNNFIIPA